MDKDPVRAHSRALSACRAGLAALRLDGLAIRRIRGAGMLVGSAVGLSLVIAVAIESPHASLSDSAARIQMSSQRKNAVIQPLMRSATDCIVRAVAADPKFQTSMRPGDINELIVAAMSACIEPMRAMIEAHDRLYGEGSGQAFFMGPYLEVLPAAVTRQVRSNLQ